MKIFKILSTAVVLGIVVFIFHNSSQRFLLSAGRSGIVTEQLNKFLLSMGATVQYSQDTVRKMAHMVEYWLLGFCSVLMLRIYTKHTLAFCGWTLFLGTLTAVMDEYVQTLTQGRTGQLSDVILDIISISVGVLLAQLCILAAKGIFGYIHQKRPNIIQKKHRKAKDFWKYICYTIRKDMVNFNKSKRSGL